MDDLRSRTSELERRLGETRRLPVEERPSRLQTLLAKRKRWQAERIHKAIKADRQRESTGAFGAWSYPGRERERDRLADLWHYEGVRRDLLLAEAATVLGEREWEDRRKPWA